MQITNVLFLCLSMLGNQEMQLTSHCISTPTRICHCHAHTSLAQAWNKRCHTICSFLIHQSTTKAPREHLGAENRIWWLKQMIFIQLWSLLRQSTQNNIKDAAEKTFSTRTAHSRKMDQAKTLIWDSSSWSRNYSTTTKSWIWTTFMELITMLRTWLMKAKKNVSFAIQALKIQ